MTDVAIPLVENVSRGSDRIAFNGETYSTTVRRLMPFFVARDQLYYWTHEWQTGEAEAMRDLGEGRYRTFPDSTSAAEWLLRDED
jgi:hypothetical protein